MAAVNVQTTPTASRALAARDQGLRPGEQLLLGMAGLGVFFGLWSLLAVLGWVPARFLPAPWSVAQTFVALLQEPFAGHVLPTHVASSIGRFLLGWALAVAVGVPLGLLMGWFRWLDEIVSPLFDALRFIPPIAWVPFAVLWFGTGPLGPTLVIFAGAFPPCVINAYRGARLADRRLVEAALTLGARPRHILLEVLLPACLPSLVAGLRISAGLGWQSLVGAELIIVSSGVGYLIVQAQSNLATAVVLSGMIAIGLVGFVLDTILRGVERRVVRGWGRT